MVNRTYRYFKGEPLYPFGFGLSYTTFKYSNFNVAKTYKTGDTVTVSVKVKNTGKMSGDEVIQLYVSNLNASVAVPIRTLKAFKRIHLNQGEEKTVRLKMNPDAFSIIDEKNKRVIKPGNFEFTVGGGQPNAKTGVKEANILKAGITLLP